jgi:hypothetical protein
VAIIHRKVTAKIHSEIDSLRLKVKLQLGHDKPTGDIDRLSSAEA